MKLKNLDPLAGIRQIVKGYFTVPRILPLELILERKATPSLLGYAIICIVVADWDKGIDRNGYIRHDIQELANAFGIKKSTLYANLRKLEHAGFLKIEQETYRVDRYYDYTLKGSQELAKTELTTAKLLSLFPSLGKYSRKIESSLSKQPDSFRSFSNLLSKSDLPKAMKQKREELLRDKSMEK